MPSLVSKWLWFVGYWLLGVAVVSTVAFVIRLVLV